MCRKTIREFDAPRARAAATYSRAFSLYVDVRIYHVISIQPKIANAITSVQKFGTMTDAMIMIT